jgi:hypothetical protein
MQFPLQRQVEMYGEHGRFAYHYTKSDTAFELILPSRRLRLNSLEKLRDPVENKDWVRARWTSGAQQDVELLDDFARRVLAETKVLSFTLDAPVEGSPEHARGYARPRMWEQYAENHAGVCLVFDRKLLAESLTSGFTHLGEQINAEVKYRDVPLCGHEGARSLVAAALTQAGGGHLEEGLRKHLRDHAMELFFRKLKDWETEREYRFLSFDDNSDEAFISYGGALHGVIVGERFPTWQMAGAKEVCKDAQAVLRQIQWGAFPPGVFDPTVAR